MPARAEPREIIHVKAVEQIARQRFTFPNQKHPHFKTYTNHPARTMGVRTASGGATYPDIVVVQDPENYVQLLGEVETAETVNEEKVAEWAALASLGPLYLFVPVGFGDTALNLCKRQKVPVVGIRTWRDVVGYDEIEISDHFTRWGGPEDLAPGILGDVLKRLL